MNEDCNYFDEDTFYMKNPNLYLTFSESEHNGYLLQENSQLILLESGLDNGLLF